MLVPIPLWRGIEDPVFRPKPKSGESVYTATAVAGSRFIAGKGILNLPTDKQIRIIFALQVLFMYEITVAKNNESQKIRSLEKQVWGEYVTSSYDMAFYVRFGYVFLAKQNNKIIGALVGLKTRDDEIKIVDWVVVKRFRKQGIGQALYKRLLIKTKDLPLIAFVKKDNKISILGHIKLGFKRIKTLKNPFGLGDDSWYLMKKESGI